MAAAVEDVQFGVVADAAGHVGRGLPRQDGVGATATVTDGPASLGRACVSAGTDEF